MRSPSRLLRPIAALSLVPVALLAAAGPASAAPPRADLAVTATAQPSTVSTAGGTLDLDVAVHNTGTATASDALVTVTLPAGASLATDGVSFNEWQCDLTATPVWRCVHGALAAGATAEALAFRIYLPGGADGDTATFSAASDDDQPGGEHRQQRELGNRTPGRAAAGRRRGEPGRGADHGRGR